MGFCRRINEKKGRDSYTGFFSPKRDRSSLNALHVFAKVHEINMGLLGIGHWWFNDASYYGGILVFLSVTLTLYTSRSLTHTIRLWILYTVPTMRVPIFRCGCMRALINYKIDDAIFAWPSPAAAARKKEYTVVGSRGGSRRTRRDGGVYFVRSHEQQQ